jgi:hypothetical protein
MGQTKSDWEALTVDDDEGVLVICPDCIRPEERQQVDKVREEGLVRADALGRAD